MCETPHTYLIEQVTAVGTFRKEQQRDKNRNTGKKEQNTLRQSLL